MLRRTVPAFVGVSAMSVFCPPCRVDLKQWCDWSKQSYDKVGEVVGASFRVCTDNENAYTMAATAVLRMIVQNDVDPTRVGMLALGTESSTDNSAGAIIVRGMVDDALEQLGLPRLARACDVIETKHACLGGIYALQGAARYCLTDGHDKLAIVVASDIASYVKGSTGEVTSGSGAVAMVVERSAKMFEVDLAKSGCASAYRGVDFRKPMLRHFIEGYGSYKAGSKKVKDWPVFSGPYSTVCYVDTVASAVEDMFGKLYASPSDFYTRTQAILFHRPYNLMPQQAMAYLYARALARAQSDEHKKKFKEICAVAKVKPEDVVNEVETAVDVDFFAFIQKNPGQMPAFHKNTEAVAKALRRDKEFSSLLEQKMSLGSKQMMSFGNLYTASLPCWMAAAFEEALDRPTDIAGQPMVCVGYGSGDAAVAMPIIAVPGWQKAARKMGVGKALEGAFDLNKEQYEGVHSGVLTTDLAADVRKMQFVVDRIGTTNDPSFADIGVEYYKFIR